MALARELGDVQRLGEQLQGLAVATRSPADETRIYDEVLACSRETGDDLLTASQLNHSFSTALHAGRIEEGSAFLEEAVVRAERIGGDLILHFLRCNLALLRLIQGRYAEAASLVRNCLLDEPRLGRASRRAS